MIQDGSIWFMQDPEGGMLFVTFANRNMTVSVSMTDVEVYDLLAMKHYRVAFKEAHNRLHVGVVSSVESVDGIFSPSEDSFWMTQEDREHMLDLMQRALYERIDSLPDKYQAIWESGTNIVNSLILQKPGKKYN